jgi:hypothetical protein
MSQTTRSSLTGPAFRWVAAGAFAGACLGGAAGERFLTAGSPDPALWRTTDTDTELADVATVVDGTLVVDHAPEGQVALLQTLDRSTVGSVRVELAPNSPPLALVLHETKPAPNAPPVDRVLRLGSGTWSLADADPQPVPIGPLTLRLTDHQATLEVGDETISLGPLDPSHITLGSARGPARVQSLRIESPSGEVILNEDYRRNRAPVRTVAVGALLGAIVGLGGPAGLLLGLPAALLAVLPESLWTALAGALASLGLCGWQLARLGLLAALLTPVAAALLRSGVLRTSTEPGPVDRLGLAGWLGAVLLVTAILAPSIGWAWALPLFLLLASPAVFLARAGLLRRAWFLRDLPALAVTLLPGGLWVLPLWRVLCVAANARPLMQSASRPASDQLFLQLPLLLLSGELALRSAHVLQVGLGANFLAGAILCPPNPALFQGRTLAPNAAIEVSGLEYRTTVHTNEGGMRGPPLPAQSSGKRPADRPLHILTVGDSFTLGMEVEDNETFTHLLGELLAKDSPTGALAWSGGVPDFSTFEAVSALPHLTRWVDPDVVVVSFYMGNDPIDNHKALNGGPDIGHNPPPGWTDIAIERLLAAGGRSVLFSQLSVFSVLARGDADSVVRAHRDEVAVAVVPAALKERLAPTREAFQRLGRACERTRYQCVVGIIPPAYTVHQERAAPTYDTFGIDPATADPRRNTQMLMDAAPPNLEMLDLGPALRAASDTQLYFQYDLHLTPAGHAVVAEAYATQIAQIRPRLVRSADRQ